MGTRAIDTRTISSVASRTSDSGELANGLRGDDRDRTQEPASEQTGSHRGGSGAGLRRAPPPAAGRLAGVGAQVIDERYRRCGRLAAPGEGGDMDHARDENPRERR